MNFGQKIPPKILKDGAILRINEWKKFDSMSLSEQHDLSLDTSYKCRIYPSEQTHLSYFNQFDKRCKETMSAGLCNHSSCQVWFFPRGDHPALSKIFKGEEKSFARIVIVPSAEVEEEPLPNPVLQRYPAPVSHPYQPPVNLPAPVNPYFNGNNTHFNYLSSMQTGLQQPPSFFGNGMPGMNLPFMPSMSISNGPIPSQAVLPTQHQRAEVVVEDPPKDSPEIIDKPNVPKPDNEILNEEFISDVPTPHIFVQSIHPTVSEGQLRTLLEECGTIADFHICTSMYRYKGKYPSHIAWVTYNTIPEAAAAVEHYHDYALQGQSGRSSQLVIEFAKEKYDGREPTENRVGHKPNNSRNENKSRRGHAKTNQTSSRDSRNRSSSRNNSLHDRDNRREQSHSRSDYGSSHRRDDHHKRSHDDRSHSTNSSHKRTRPDETPPPSNLAPVNNNNNMFHIVHNPQQSPPVQNPIQPAMDTQLVPHLLAMNSVLTSMLIQQLQPQQPTPAPQPFSTVLAHDATRDPRNKTE